MEIKILQVFLGADGLPYKDQERTVHFPIVGSGFQGASNTTKIRFYYDELVEQDDSETSWVACAKLPNGKIGSKVLETDYDSTLGEHYALLELDSFYFQYKGDVYISLQGYQGGVQVSYDEETELYTINGTPTIAATGSIKLSVNYATQFVGSGETSNVNFQRILADLGTKLGIRAQSEHVEELPSVGQNDIFYVVNDDPNDTNLQNIYVWNENTQSYVWVGDNTLDLGEYYTKQEGETFESGIDSLVQSIASGSPAGTYATVSALTTADPDHSKIYLVLADGKWYYYNTGTSAWTAGGDYLSNDNALSSEIELDLEDGFVNSDGWIGIPQANGEKFTQLLKVEQGEKYTVLVSYSTARTDWVGVGYYADDGSFIERVILDNNANITEKSIDFEISNANYKYMIVSSRTYGETGSFKLFSHNEIEKINNDISVIKNVISLNNLSKSNGYLNNDGTVSSQHETRKEVYTEKVICENGATYFCEVRLKEMTSVGTLWFAYVLYDKNGNALGRTTVFEKYTNYTFANFTINNANAKYIAFTYRTYGDNLDYVNIFGFDAFNNLIKNYTKTEYDFNVLENEYRSGNEIALDVVPGYIDANGVYTLGASANGEVFSQLIPVRKGFVLKIDVSFSTTRSFWLAAAKYKGDATFIQRQEIVNPNTNVLSGTYYLNITDDNTKYVIITYRGFGETNPVKVYTYDKINQIKDETDYVKDVTSLSNLKTYSGYIQTNGTIGDADTTNKEVYTGKALVSNGDVVLTELRYNSSSVKAMWFAYALYDQNANFIERVLLYGSSTNYVFKKIEINNPNAKYIAFTYRTYGENFDFFHAYSKNALVNLLENASEQDLDFAYLKNENVKSVNHRGFNTIAPENTLPAFKLSKQKGFKIVECDVEFTSDGVAVILHDSTINRTARNEDGTSISETIYINQITYEQSQDYDFGIWKGEEYAGTKIPTFEQFISLCRKIGLEPYIEVKTGTQAQIEGLVDVVNNYQMLRKVTWISASTTYLQYVLNKDAKARVGYVVMTISASTITAIQELSTENNDVFIDSNSYTSEEIALCKNANIPLEVWTYNNDTTINDMNGYISGITSDNLVAGYELYKASIN